MAAAWRCAVVQVCVVVVVVVAVVFVVAAVRVACFCACFSCQLSGHLPTVYKNIGLLSSTNTGWSTNTETSG